jgi:hypothetical protein
MSLRSRRSTRLRHVSYPGQPGRDVSFAEDKHSNQTDRAFPCRRYANRHRVSTGALRHVKIAASCLLVADIVAKVADEIELAGGSISDCAACCPGFMPSD